MLKTSPLAFDHEIVICADNGVEFSVTLIDANHCFGMFLFWFDLLGSAMFLFKLGETVVLYTGDTRLEQSHVDTILSDTLRSTNHLYIDSTFCSSEFANIPSKEESINALINFINSKPGITVFRIDCLLLGYADILRSIVYTFSSKIYVRRGTKRFKVYEKLFPDLITSDPTSTRFHCCGDRRGDMCGDCRILSIESGSCYYSVVPTTMGWKDTVKNTIGPDTQILSLNEAYPNRLVRV
jgi:hypothetical protein